MLLAIDARNSSVNVGFRRADQWLKVVQLSPDRTADEYAMLMRAAGQELGELRIGRCFIASVVPALTPRLVQAVGTAFGREARLVGPGIRSGIRIRTDQPSEVGADIVCSALAAHRLAGGACVVVDFATAITLSAVNAQAELLGVAIAPGMETASRALRSSAAQLSDVRLEAPAGYIGRNTSQAMQSGLVLGYTGLVDYLLRGMATELGQDCAVIGTGAAYGQQLLERLGHLRFAPDLALEGLAAIAQLNS